jgi:hypothetical protein
MNGNRPNAISSGASSGSSGRSAASSWGNDEGTNALLKAPVPYKKVSLLNPQNSFLLEAANKQTIPLHHYRFLFCQHLSHTQPTLEPHYLIQPPSTPTSALYYLDAAFKKPKHSRAEKEAKRGRWLRRNWVLVILAILGLVGLFGALILFLEPCPLVEVTETVVSDVETSVAVKTNVSVEVSQGSRSRPPPSPPS